MAAAGRTTSVPGGGIIDSRAAQSLNKGDLSEALAQLQAEVRDSPADAKLRIFLFQLLAVNGEWNRALTQLNVAGEMDDANLAMVHTYREALGCEALRAEIFAGERSALIFGEPATWLAELVEALRLTGGGKLDEGAQLRAQAFDAAPTTKGTLDGQPFEWIADADARLGPVLEVILNGRYYWVPFQHIRELHIEEPADLRDVVWMPAHFTWTNGGEMVGLIPTRYAGTHESSDDALRLARKTEWIEATADEFHGAGQRLLATDAGEYPLMDVRHVVLETGTERQPSENA